MAEVACRCPLLATRPGFHGRCHRGHMRCVRALRRYQAALRQAAGRPLASRRPRIAAPASEPARTRPKRCLWPWKNAYPDQAAASAALVLMRRAFDRKRRMEAYRCHAGHWHVGNPKPIVRRVRLAVHRGGLNG